MSLIHFLLTYDLRRRRLEVKSFADAAEAMLAYGEAERAHLDDREVEIVLIGADSLETIKQTHGHYFSKGGDVRLPGLAAN